MYTHQKQFITAGKPFGEANKAIVMIHGRGGGAEDIISLQRFLKLDDMAISAPQASNNSWYPYSFMAPEQDNQPALDSAIATIAEVVEEIKANGIKEEQIYFLGFSQGACLTLEYVARNATKYGGVVALTGGLIGEQLKKARYQGDFQQTPILVTTSDPDPHVPLSRVEESVSVLEALGAQVSLKIFKGKMHSISKEELDLANRLVFAEVV
ncbi:alpha/beta hydrolase [Olivibacter sp. XZL3]|uniref:alpha/beta hydrolase n=1 Tax=Olivibacter sp. XZL3 TaxID=1735116 RepID=UPI001064A498|nr:prolyl oligopeptidase family serine peptidase [Olivibacter sp. XZL3]